MKAPETVSSFALYDELVKRDKKKTGCQCADCRSVRFSIGHELEKEVIRLRDLHCDYQPVIWQQQPVDVEQLRHKPVELSDEQLFNKVIQAVISAVPDGYEADLEIQGKITRKKVYGEASTNLPPEIQEAVEKMAESAISNIERKAIEKYQRMVIHERLYGKRKRKSDFRGSDPGEDKTL